LDFILLLPSISTGSSLPRVSPISCNPLGLLAKFIAIILGVYVCASLGLLQRRKQNHTAPATAITSSATPIAIPATAAPDSEVVLRLSVPLGDAGDNVCVEELIVGSPVSGPGVVTPEGTAPVIAACRTLKPLTCIPYTIVGPAEAVEVGGTVEVTMPHGPPGVVDS